MNLPAMIGSCLTMIKRLNDGAAALHGPLDAGSEHFVISCCWPQ